MTLAQGAALTREPAPASEPASATNAASAVDPKTLDTTELGTLLTTMVTEVRAARSVADLDWRISELLVGPLDEFIGRVQELLPHIPEEDLTVPVEDLDEAISQATLAFMASTELVVALSDKAAAEQDQDAQQIEESVARPDPQDLLYGEDLPPAVQEALYDGQSSYLCLLALLDAEPLASWLLTELQQRMLDGQRNYLRLLIAYAREAEVPVPDLELLRTLEPLDLEQASRDADLQRRAIDRYLDSARSAQDKS